jgi:hypothetical protein
LRLVYPFENALLSGAFYGSGKRAPLIKQSDLRAMIPDIASGLKSLASSLHLDSGHHFVASPGVWAGPSCAPKLTAQVSLIRETGVDGNFT